MNPLLNRRLWLRMLLRLALLPLLALAGCASVSTTPGGVPIDTSRSAKGQDSRVLFLVIHYTVADRPQSLHILTQQDVSAHYLLTDESPPRIYRLVDESQRAWHSGVSGWKGHRLLNASSIGIEIVHPGFKLGPDKQRIYQPFPQAQIDALVPLVKDIVQRHAIRPERILGHGEVTPSYKEDPGPTFPWKRFADLGITPPWPEAGRVAAQRALYEAQLPDAAWFRALVAKALLIDCCDAIVTSEKVPGFKANIVAYTVALLSHERGDKIDLEAVWRAQAVDAATQAWFRKAIPVVRQHITRPATEGKNAGEISKKEDCWKQLLTLWAAHTR